MAGEIAKRVPNANSALAEVLKGRRYAARTSTRTLLCSENPRLAGFVCVDIRGRDLKRAVLDLQNAVDEHLEPAPCLSAGWSGQFRFLERATAKLKWVVPFTRGICVVLLHLTFRRFNEALLILATLPFALIGGF